MPLFDLDDKKGKPATGRIRSTKRKMTLGLKYTNTINGRKHGTPHACSFPMRRTDANANRRLGHVSCIVPKSRVSTRAQISQADDTLGPKPCRIYAPFGDTSSEALGFQFEYRLKIPDANLSVVAAKV